MIIEQVPAPVIQRAFGEGILLFDWKVDHIETSLVADDKPFTIWSIARLNSIDASAYDWLGTHFKPSVCLRKSDMRIVEATVLRITNLTDLKSIL